MILRRKSLKRLYFLLKLTVIIAVICLVLTALQLRSSGRRGSAALLTKYTHDQVRLFEESVLADELRIQPGLGDGGEPVTLTGEDKLKGDRSEKKLAMNVFLSDRIAYNRTLKDFRNPKCQQVMYDAELPSASVILIFHNEPYSVLVRTVWSVLNSVQRTNSFYKKAVFTKPGSGVTMKLGYPGQDPASQFVYLKEIILVDDSSTLPELGGKLDYYVDTRLPTGIVRILRLHERSGLIKARVHGARAARGDALVFLDAHCETGADWLRPLLQRVKDRNTRAVCPVIDIIDQAHFGLEAVENAQIGGFAFTGHFTWIDVSKQEKKRRGSEIAPTFSPTMAGGLFAIDRSYFWEIGAYDEQMNGWGGENLEMSFRIWQCGGTLETIPCSRVGHVFRAFHPYGLPGNSDTHGINTARMAEVWMDEYKELFYMHRRDLRNNPKIGDITHRQVLRQKLRCKSFQWYLENVYPEKYVPVRDVVAYGRFRNPSTNLCLDNMQRDLHAAALGLYTCHSEPQYSQQYTLSLDGELRTEEKCAEVRRSREDTKVTELTSKQVIMMDCHGKKREQLWRHSPTGQLRNVRSGLCLDAAGGAVGGQDVVARKCDDDSITQIWEIDFTELNNFGIERGKPLTSQQENLEKIRKASGTKRRISRFLQSITSHEQKANSDLVASWMRPAPTRRKRATGLNATQTQTKTKSKVQKQTNTTQTHLKQKQTRLKAQTQTQAKTQINATHIQRNTKQTQLKKQKKIHLNKMHKKKILKTKMMDKFEINAKFPLKMESVPVDKLKRRKREQKKKIKNKFVLEIRKKLPNNTQDHLEIEIMCKHRQLYPNNTFVRELVQILNKHDISVINNGKVFDKTGIYDLPKENVTHDEPSNNSPVVTTPRRIADPNKILDSAKKSIGDNIIDGTESKSHGYKSTSKDQGSTKAYEDLSKVIKKLKSDWDAKSVDYKKYDPNAEGHKYYTDDEKLDSRRDRTKHRKRYKIAIVDEANTDSDVERSDSDTERRQHKKHVSGNSDIEDEKAKKDGLKQLATGKDKNGVVLQKPQLEYLLKRYGVADGKNKSKNSLNPDIAYIDSYSSSDSESSGSFESKTTRGLKQSDVYQNPDSGVSYGALRRTFSSELLYPEGGALISESSDYSER